MQLGGSILLTTLGARASQVGTSWFIAISPSAVYATLLCLCRTDLYRQLPQQVEDGGRK